MAQPHAATGQVVHLSPLADQLPQAQTTAILKAEQLELVRIVLAKGKSIPSTVCKVRSPCCAWRAALH